MQRYWATCQIVCLFCLGFFCPRKLLRFICDRGFWARGWVDSLMPPATRGVASGVHYVKWSIGENRSGKTNTRVDSHGFLLCWESGSRATRMIQIGDAVLKHSKKWQRNTLGRWDSCFFKKSYHCSAHLDTADMKAAARLVTDSSLLTALPLRLDVKL